MSPARPGPSPSLENGPGPSILEARASKTQAQAQAFEPSLADTSLLDTGQHPQLGVEPLRESHLETLNDFTSRMEKTTDGAHSALTQAADDMARFYDAHRREAPL